LARTHPAHARSSGSETLLRSRSLAGYTIDMHESEFSEATPQVPNLKPRECPPIAGYLAETRNSRLVSNCVVGLGGFELPTSSL
jgi:hypothetical protein